jgi:hypothetical protein
VHPEIIRPVRLRVVRGGQELGMGSRSHNTRKPRPCRLPIGYHT